MNRRNFLGGLAALPFALLGVRTVVKAHVPPPPTAYTLPPGATVTFPGYEQYSFRPHPRQLEFIEQLVRERQEYLTHRTLELMNGGHDE